MKDVALPPLRIEQESNGLTLIAIERRGVPLFHCRISLPAGASQDPVGKEGLAQFTAELLRRGTQKRDANGVDDLVEGMGASMGEEVTLDETALGITVPMELAAASLDALFEVTFTPSFPENEVELLRRRQVSALQSALDDPGVVAGRATVTLGYGETHPYGHPTSGFTRSVESFTRSDVVAFQSTRYQARGAVIAVAGSATPDELLRLVRGKLGAVKFGSGAPAVAIPPPAERSGLSALVVHKPDSSQAQIRIVAPGTTRRDPRWIPAVVANTALGGGFTSLLVDAIRVDRGLSYSVSTRLVMNRHAGLSIFSSFTKNETLRELVDVALDKMRGFAQTGPSVDTLDKAKSYLAGLFPFGLESPEALCDQVADTVLEGLGLDYLARYRSSILAVTPAQAREAAALLTPTRDGARLVIVGDAEVAQKALSSLCPIDVVALDRYV